MTNKRNLILTLFSLTSLVMTACGGGSDSKKGSGDGDGNGNGNNTETMSLFGTAAVGAAISNGTLLAKCADGSGFTQSVVTDANGTWSGKVSSDALPCALQISGGTPNVTLHSLATDSGVTNVTPLTDLVMALATNEDP